MLTISKLTAILSIACTLQVSRAGPVAAAAAVPLSSNGDHSPEPPSSLLSTLQARQGKVPLPKTDRDGEDAHFGVVGYPPERKGCTGLPSRDGVSVVRLAYGNNTNLNAYESINSDHPVYTYFSITRVLKPGERLDFSVWGPDGSGGEGYCGKYITTLTADDSRVKGTLPGQCLALADQKDPAAGFSCVRLWTDQ